MAELNVQTLKSVLNDAIDGIGVAVEAFPWEDRRAYSIWLAQTYYLVRHTHSFLCLTAARFGHWNREMQSHQIWHLRAELGHDQLLLNDLERIGARLEDFEALPETSALYQSQYYFIEIENPAAHLAYAHLLEGAAAKKIKLIYKRAEASHSSDACTFLRVHMEDDPDHFERGLTLLERLTATEMEAYFRNLNEAAYFYVKMLEHIESAN